jgi:hypothetical protein
VLAFRWQGAKACHYHGDLLPIMYFVRSLTRTISRVALRTHHQKPQKPQNSCLLKFQQVYQGSFVDGRRAKEPRIHRLPAPLIARGSQRLSRRMSLTPLHLLRRRDEYSRVMCILPPKRIYTDYLSKYLLLSVPILFRVSVVYYLFCF